MKLRVVNSFVCVFRVEFALPCFAKSRSHREEWKQPEISGWLFCTGDLSQLFVSRLFSPLISICIPIYSGVWDPACACASTRQGRPHLPLASSPFLPWTAVIRNTIATISERLGGCACPVTCHRPSKNYRLSAGNFRPGSGSLMRSGCGSKC